MSLSFPFIPFLRPKKFFIEIKKQLEEIDKLNGIVADNIKETRATLNGQEDEWFIYIGKEKKPCGES